MIRISWIVICLSLVGCASVPSDSTGQRQSPDPEQDRLVRLCADEIDPAIVLSAKQPLPTVLSRSEEEEAQLVKLTLMVLIPKDAQSYRQEVICTISTEEEPRVVGMVYSMCGEGC